MYTVKDKFGFAEVNMNAQVTLSITLPLAEAQQVINFCSKLVTEAGLGPAAQAEVVAPDQRSASADLPEDKSIEMCLTLEPLRLRELSNSQDRKVMEYVQQHGPRFYNRDLAAALGLDNPARTSTFLGHITRKLRRVGVNAPEDWYTTDRTANGTLLTIRADIMEKFVEALKDGHNN